MTDKKPKSKIEGLSGAQGKIIQPEEVKAGQTLRIHQKIRETTPKGEEKERIQVYEGMVLQVGGSGISRSMTVRKISNGVGVEKVFPLHLPTIAALELVKMAKVRRANLNYTKASKKKLKERMVTE